MNIFAKSIARLGVRLDIYGYGDNAPRGSLSCILSPLTPNAADEEHTPHGHSGIGRFVCYCSAAPSLPSPDDGYVVIGGRRYTLLRDVVMSFAGLEYRRAVLCRRLNEEVSV